METVSLHSSLLAEAQPVDVKNVLEIIGDFLATEYAQHITVENISMRREQELICKGMFTELW